MYANLYVYICVYMNNYVCGFMRMCKVLVFVYGRLSM